MAQPHSLATYLQRIYSCTPSPSTLLHSCTLCIATLLHIIYSAHLHPSLHYNTNPYTPTQTYILPTYQPYKYPYTLHTYPTPKHLPYLPALPLQTHQPLHTDPTPTHLPYPYIAYTLLCMYTLLLRTCSMSVLIGSKLQCAAVCFGVLQYIAVCCR